MKKRFSKRLFSVAIILIMTLLAFLFIHPGDLPLFPTQQTPVMKGIEMGPVTSGFVILHEIKMKRDYLNGIAILAGKSGTVIESGNVLLLLDRKYNILATLRLDAGTIDALKYYSFSFHERIRVGIGQTCFLAFYCLKDGDGQLLVGRNRIPESGSTLVYPLVNQDVFASIGNKGSAMTFPGGLCIKTFESDAMYLSPLMKLIAVAVLLLSLTIIFFDQIKSFLLRFRLTPHALYLFIALVFGHLFLVITPPLQVPDENSHFYRSYQVASGNFFKFDETVPFGLTFSDSLFRRLFFNRYETTGIDEILSATDLKIDPRNRIRVYSPDYLIPFIPQAAGIRLGMVFDLPPVILIYLGRLFNLWISVMLIFLAIKEIPFQKWLLFLLGTMPMTVYLLASLSYDALTISLSFLLVSKMLKLAFVTGSAHSLKDLLTLTAISVLLAMCKPPYMILTLLFLIIPFHRFGTLKKYLLYAAILLLSTIAANRLWPVIRLLDQDHQLNKQGATFTVVPPRYQFAKTSSENGANRLNVEGNALISRFSGTPVLTFHSPAIYGGSVIPESTERNAESKPADKWNNLHLETAESSISLSPEAGFRSEVQKNQDPGNGVNSTVANTNDGLPVNSPSTATGPSPPLRDPNGPVDNIDPGQQIEFIRQNPARYATILWHTLLAAGDTYLEGFVGKFGWLFVPLPGWLIGVFYVMLFFIVFFDCKSPLKISLYQRGIFIMLFLLGYMLIQTAMYISWNTVSGGFIDGVQGRYFIPMAPVFFLIFCSHWVGNRFVRKSPKLKDQVKESHKAVGSRKAGPVKSSNIIYEKKSGTQTEKQPRLTDYPLTGIDLFVPLIVGFFSVATLLTSLYVILERFYVITI